MPEMSKIKTVFTFLDQLKENNNREWFNSHKKQYREAHEVMIAFADALIKEMEHHDQIETPDGKKSLYRIYRDTRFSNNKTPYKTHWAGHMRRATSQLRGGYYFHLQPGNSLVAGGFFGPNAQDLKHIRDHIAQDDEPLRSVLADKNFQKVFGELRGEKVKTAPKGFTKDHPSIDLLRYKQFMLQHNFTDKEVLSQSFLSKMVQSFVDMRPFLDYMSEVLTTDLNGVPLEGT